MLTFAAVALLGMALGMVLSKVAATPAAVALAYAAMAPAVADPSTRISRTVLTGAVAPCCSSSEQLNVRTLATVALAACLIGGMAVLSLVLTRSRRTRGAALTLGLALSAFLVWSATMGTTPMSQIETRTTAAVCNRNDGRMYCVWPEHARARPEIVRFASQAAAAAQTLGINLPTSWSEKETPNTMTFFWAMDATAREHKYALGVDIAHWLGCSSPDAESELASYLALTMGIPLDELANRDPITAVRASQRHAHPPQEWNDKRCPRDSRVPPPFRLHHRPKVFQLSGADWLARCVRRARDKPRRPFHQRKLTTAL